MSTSRSISSICTTSSAQHLEGGRTMQTARLHSAHQQVELIEVTMHQALGRQAGHELHALHVHADRVPQLPDLCPTGISTP